MCNKRYECQNPDRLIKGKVEECTPEQIRKCHGDARAHPCAEGEKTPEKKDEA
jgi:hypothetical protein